MTRHDGKIDMISKRFPFSSQSCVIIICFLISPAISENCKYDNPCKCTFTNGSVIDLSSIASEDGARWKNMTAENKDPYFYYYNPCYNFKLGPEDTECEKGVAVCQVYEKEKQYLNCGDQQHASFLWDKQTSALTLYYNNTLRQTYVVLVCSHDSEKPVLQVIGEKNKTQYHMVLTSKCACADGCLGSRLSFGSGLLIIFFISVLLYLFLGIVYMHLVRGAHGLELIPNYEFWKDFPLLVRDGCIFVSSGCRRETSYERI